MMRFVFRRLLQAALTIFGVMIITFLLFRAVAGDIAAVFVGDKGTEQGKAAWRHLHGYDRPLLVNVHRRLSIEDHTRGDGSLQILDAEDSKAADYLALLPADDPERAGHLRLGRYVWRLHRGTPVEKLTGGKVLQPERGAGRGKYDAKLKIRTSDGSEFTVDVAGATTAGELIDRINNHQANRSPRTPRPLVTAGIRDWSWRRIARSQFVDHLVGALTFRSRSLTDNQKLTDIIAQRAPKSLALTVPAMALGWVTAMVISCIVAYYRGRLVDKVGVFLSVLGMCVPFLAFMIYGQYLMFKIAPGRAYGLANRANIYVPVAIMVLAGLGGSVRFYRTVILDEINRDYVRTARAKGAPLPTILFKHVLKNCMLPILTNLILSIPFLIMGSLLVESYFGIPGLGDLMLTSINGRDEPIMSGLVFLSALIYTVGILLTDLSYAVFDPRIRLR